jgi:hypothetical protein
MTPIDFAKALLSRLGLPQSENNIAALVGLQVQEGGHSANSAKFNPMNVTQIVPGVSKLAPGFSQSGPQIQAYPDWQTGLEATATLLMNGKYKGVLASLAKSASPADTLKEIALSPYGWYDIIKGVRVPKAYPQATVAALNWRSYGAKLFPPGGGDFGGMIERGEQSIKELFTFKTTASKVGAAVVGVGLIAGVVAIGYVLLKHHQESSETRS